MHNIIILNINDVQDPFIKKTSEKDSENQPLESRVVTLS